MLLSLLPLWGMAVPPPPAEPPVGLIAHAHGGLCRGGAEIQVRAGPRLLPLSFQRPGTGESLTNSHFWRQLRNLQNKNPAAEDSGSRIRNVPAENCHEAIR
jgi:hypothetical protein